ncbi:MAG TPA: YlbF family regulator [Gemmatimonadales bacterium]|nr:YlbF family regulator [Gemmatimonadales bacterium]
MIDDKAQELGRLLGQSEEYRALVRATDRMKADADCQKLLADVERLAQAMEHSAQGGHEPSREQIEEYDRAVQIAQTNPVYQQVVAAQANFEKLMAKVNARIYDGIKKGAASPIITLG